ncbi:hypothetical protein LUZ61_006016 [Rhynchospora tenuis]|uniref:F-box domain-containing protein n=1 Tax=Rhynchospora tenuis TaxID=198213 RepID=A0AAD6EV38_9POAL|nr:hypothetical protein LUZ61_006016 [Rhynchospora tenuis]
MDNLPSDILLDIFARLPDSTDLASCRLTSHRLLSLSYQVSSISIQQHKHYNPIPFKARVTNLVSLLSSSLQSISISAKSDDHAVLGERDSGAVEIDEINDLTDFDFLSAWLPLVDRQLKSLSIDNCWSKYRAGFSSALSLISDICNNLENLVIRKAWLSFSCIKPMPTLTSLTLEFVTIDDENLGKINECLPYLQVLNMTRIIGLKEPKIHLLHLQACCFTGYPRSMTIHAPNLTKLKLRCIEPSLLILKCPSLSEFNISIVKPSGTIRMEIPKVLEKLTVKSLDIPQLLRFFKGTNKLRTLELEVSPIMSWFESYTIFSMSDILEMFGSIDELIFGPVAWYLWRRSFPPCPSISNRICSRKITVKLPPDDFNDIGLTSNVLKMCARSCQVHLLFYSDVDEMQKADIIAKLLNSFPGVKWTWSTSEKLSIEFFNRLPQPHLYTSLQR